ncbi:MAG: nicotinate-nucleotide--dimethylbenzimidazole phosphoribosyltransferase [Bacilli bacterium]
MKWREAIRAIEPLDEAAMRGAEEQLNRLTKPLGSLGELERLVVQLAGIRGDHNKRTRQKAIYLFAGDHGIADHGVSAFPKAVTAQMVQNFAYGGAAINVLARTFGAQLTCVDVGVACDLTNVPGVKHMKVRAEGTRAFLESEALTEMEVEQALNVGVQCAKDAFEQGMQLVIPGEMGIGNTATSSILFAVLAGRDVAEVTGHGTGMHGEALTHKQRVLQQAQAFHNVDGSDVLAVMRTFGGLEIIAIAGFMIGAAAYRIPVVVDGFIVSVAALLAALLAPSVQPFFIASHLSDEQAHKEVLDALELTPLLHIGMRLGEASGAAFMMPIIEAAESLLNEMATFEDANVDGPSANS